MKKLIVLILVILAILCFSPTTVKYQRIEPPQVAVEAPPKVVKAPQKRVIAKKAVYTKPEVKPEVKAYIDDIFGENATIATAVLMHESGLRLDAKNWNCIYEGKSTFCKKEDRDKAVSVDCGIAQKNVKGQVCPAHLMTLEGNMEAIRKVYETQGLGAWASFRNGAYKKFL